MSGKRVKTARGRSTSSVRWLTRQLNDPYVAAAKRDGYRSRAAYKLIELDERFGFFAANRCVIDLGCAPGGWSQIAAQKCDARRGKGQVLGVDIADMDALPGVDFVKMDFMDDAAPARLQELAARRPDIVLSDMAAPATGHKQTDHLRTIALAEAAAHFALQSLAEGGCFCTKLLQGGAQGALLATLKKRFGRVKHVKPAASRKQSSELYLVGIGFGG